MKRCNIEHISEVHRKFFFSDKNGYVPLPGDEMSDFNFDWGPLQNSPADTKQQRAGKKNKRKSSFVFACSENINIAHIKCNINTSDWKEKDGK